MRIYMISIMLEPYEENYIVQYRGFDRYLFSFLHPVKKWYGYTESLEIKERGIVGVKCVNLYFADQDTGNKCEKLIKDIYDRKKIGVEFSNQGYVDIDVEGDTDPKDGTVTIHSKFKPLYEGIELIDNIDWLKDEIGTDYMHEEIRLRQ